MLKGNSRWHYFRLLVATVFENFHWVRDMLIATGIAAVTALWQLTFKLVQSEKKTVFLVTVLVPYAAVLLVNFGWRLLWAPWKLHMGAESKVQDLQTAIHEKNRELEGAKSAVTSADWKELAESFKEYVRSGVTADWQHSSLTDTERWSLCGAQPNAARHCESLCKLAGAMLLNSHNMSKRVSAKVRSYAEDDKRWLCFLKDNYDAVEHHGYGIENVGDKQNIISIGTIRELPSVAARACIDCAAHEIGKFHYPDFEAQGND